MRRRAIVRARSRRAFRPIWRSPASPGSCFACSRGAFGLALFASLLRLVCQPAVALEEPELVARRKELQPERFGLRPDLHELVGLGGSRLQFLAVARRRNRAHQRSDVLAEPRLAVLQLAERSRRAAQVLLGVEALALDPGCQRLVPAQLRVEAFGGRGQPEHVWLA